MARCSSFMAFWDHFGTLVPFGTKSRIRDLIGAPVYLVSLVQKIGDPIFGLFAHFYGQKLPQSAINEEHRAISRPGCPKLVDPSGFRLDLGGIHPGGCVSAF